MLNRILKAIYMGGIRFYGHLFKRKQLKKQIVYLMSFPGNDQGFIEAVVAAQPQTPLFILYYQKCQSDINTLSADNIQFIQLDSMMNFVFKAIPLLMKSKIVISDNYFPFLGALPFQKAARIMQIWHAGGAVKAFGLQDKRIKLRSKSDNKRYREVYQCFTDYFVASNKMGNVFHEAYAAPFEAMRILGYPRSDVYFHDIWIENARQAVFKLYPEAKKKKVIFYAPTYREEGLPQKELPIERMRSLYPPTEYMIFASYHPHTQGINSESADGQYYILNDRRLSSAALLCAADCLITDYSSMVFDYTLIGSEAKRIIYWCYDLSEYESLIGLQEDIFAELPGTLAISEEELLVALKKETARKNIEQFNQLWNTENDGAASLRAAAYIAEVIEGV